MTTVTADIVPSVRGGPMSLDGYAAGPNQSADLSLGAVDELRMHVVPIKLGAGERVFDGVGGWAFNIGRIRPTEHVVHVTLRLPAR